MARGELVYGSRLHKSVFFSAGDAAHGMYSVLGQGLSCGLEGAVKLANSLASAGKDDVAAALAAYSQAAVPEAHAATQLSTTIGHSLFGSCKPAKLVAAALLPHGGLPFFRRISDPSVTRRVLKMAV